MRLRDRRQFKKPELVIIPMIDIMFFLLVFFMLSTMYMTELKALPIRLPTAQSTEIIQEKPFVVTMKEDGTVWIEEQQADLDQVIRLAKEENKRNPKFSVMIRGDEGVEYGKIIRFLDLMKSAGITRIGLAAERGSAA